MFLVTGSSGYVGSSLIPMLRTYGKVVGVDRLPSSRTTLIEDIASPDLMFRLKELDDGYYLAGSSVEIGDGVLSDKACLYLSKDPSSFNSAASQTLL